MSGASGAESCAKESGAQVSKRVVSLVMGLLHPKNGIKNISVYMLFLEFDYEFAARISFISSLVFLSAFNPMSL